VVSDKTNAANATKLKLISCSERASLRFFRTLITSVNHSWLNCCIRLLPVNNVFGNRLLFTSGKVRLGMYLWNSGTIRWIFDGEGMWLSDCCLCKKVCYPHASECVSSKCPSRNRSSTRLQRLWDPPIISSLPVRAYLLRGLAVRAWDFLHVGLRSRMG